MANKLPIAKISEKVSEYLHTGRRFIITAKTLVVYIHEHKYEELALLRDILKDNTTVVTLDICCNGSTENYDASFQLISDILQTNKTIDSLFIRGHSLKDTYTKSIFMGLSQNKTIKKLLIHTPIGTQGYYFLTELIKVTNTLSYINIYNEENIYEQSIKQLSAALKINRSLRTLILRAQIHHIDILGEALPYNTTLRLLQFNAHSDILTEDQVESFGRAIERNIGLETLTIDIPSVYAKNILKSLTINNTISNLGLTGYGTKLDFTADDQSWIPEIKGLTYIDGSHELLDRVLIENKRAIKQKREDLKILLFNLARSSAALELFPIEIWQHIFDFLVYPGTHVGDLAEIIFPKAWTLDFTAKKKPVMTNKNNFNNNANTNVNNNRDDNNNSSRFCVLL